VNGGANPHFAAERHSSRPIDTKPLWVQKRHLPSDNRIQVPQAACSIQRDHPPKLHQTMAVFDCRFEAPRLLLTSEQSPRAPPVG
jgi:hypothetical protein